MKQLLLSLILFLTTAEINQALLAAYWDTEIELVEREVKTMVEIGRDIDRMQGQQREGE